MTQKLLKLINQIKDEFRELDDEGVSHPKIDFIYEKLTELEDILYEYDESSDQQEDYYE